MGGGEGGQGPPTALEKNWLPFGSYHPPSQSDEYFFRQIEKGLDIYSKFYERYMLIGDFNGGESEPCLSKFFFKMAEKYC